MNFSVIIELILLLQSIYVRIFAAGIFKNEVNKLTYAQCYVESHVCINIGHCVMLTFFEGKLVRFSYVNVFKRELFNLIKIRSFWSVPL